MYTDFRDPCGGILTLNIDINPHTNSTLYCIITLTSEDNGETIKQLVQEYITFLLQGVQAV